MRARIPIRVAFVAVCLAAAALPGTAQDLASFEQHLTVHELDNGLTFLIYERPAAPVVSFFTHVDAGGAQEVPGITGLAQVNGLRGETRDLDKMSQRVRYDLEYVKNWSLGLDIRILIKTARIVLTDRSAY